MTTILMDMDECEIAHEALLLKEFSEEVNYAEPAQQRAPAGETKVEKAGKHERGRSRNPRFMRVAAPKKMLGSVRLLLSSTLPKCP